MAQNYLTKAVLSALLLVACRLGSSDSSSTADVLGSVHFVQASSATPQSPQAAVPVTLPNAQSAGDLNVVVVGPWDDAANVSSVTDSAGNTYALAVGPTRLAGSGSQWIYYAKNIAASTTNTVTVQFTAPANFADVRVLEYSGLDANDPVDGTAVAPRRGSSAGPSG